MADVLHESGDQEVFEDDKQDNDSGIQKDEKDIEAEDEEIQRRVVPKKRASKAMKDFRRSNPSQLSWSNSTCRSF